jgi:hypothetical protein
MGKGGNSMPNRLDGGRCYTCRTQTPGGEQVPWGDGARVQLSFGPLTFQMELKKRARLFLESKSNGIHSQMEIYSRGHFLETVMPLGVAQRFFFGSVWAIISSHPIYPAN